MKKLFALLVALLLVVGLVACTTTQETTTAGGSGETTTTVDPDAFDLEAYVAESTAIYNSVYAEFKPLEGVTDYFDKIFEENKQKNHQNNGD